MSKQANEWTNHFVRQAARKQGVYKPVYKIATSNANSVKLVSPAAQSNEMARARLKRTIKPIQRSSKKAKINRIIKRKIKTPKKVKKVIKKSRKTQIKLKRKSKIKLKRKR